MIRIIMAVNGERGRNHGRIDRIDFEADNELLVSLEWTYGDAFCPYSHIPQARGVVIDTEFYTYARYLQWCGSMAFDGIECSDATAERLAHDLNQMRGWNCVEGIEGVFEAWERDDIRFSDVTGIDYMHQERAGQMRLFDLDNQP